MAVRGETYGEFLACRPNVSSHGPCGFDLHEPGAQILPRSLADNTTYEPSYSVGSVDRSDLCSFWLLSISNGNTDQYHDEHVDISHDVKSNGPN